MELVDLHSKSYAKHEEVRAECSEDRVFPALLAEIMTAGCLRSEGKRRSGLTS